VSEVVTTNRPVIGVTAGHHDATWGVWKASAVLVTASYVRAVEGSGGLPVVLPAFENAASDEEAVESARRLVRGIDGLILTGGADVDPQRYGCAVHAATRIATAARDSTELALVRAADERDLPVLAICRGAQVLNVARGGTLHQHLPDLVGSSVHAPVKGGHGLHRVRIASSGRLADVLEKVLTDRPDRTVDVPTSHHQAVDRVGADLVESAWAEDGTIEAVEAPGPRFVLGVQWHPEAGDDATLFRALIHAASGA